MQHRNIIITGASSGIGAALARRYAGAGTHLGLLGRDEARLAQVAAECRTRGASAVTGTADVCDADAMRAWISAFDTATQVDLVVANAGLSAGGGEAGESEELVKQLFDVNVAGVLNTIYPLIPRMRQRGSGQIALMSSLAGIRGLPSCPAYSASKMAVRALGEGLRGSLAESGVRVSVICPGYVKTPMTATNRFPMPFIMSPEEAADVIAAGLARNRSRIAFPLALYLPLRFLAGLPLWLTDPIFAALPKKDTMEKS